MTPLDPKDTPLTWDDLEAEVEKVQAFFSKLPEEYRADAANRLIFEIVNQASYNHYEALGIFTEAMNSYRDTAIQVAAEEAEDDAPEDTKP